ILMTTLTEGKFWGSFTNYEPTSQDNVFKYVTFEYGVNSNFNEILERGVLALNKAKALISYCTFRNNTGDDAVTLVKSESTVEYSQFLNNISDAIDQGFTWSEIRYNYAEGNGNDAWDLGDGSQAWVHHNVAYKNGDKCVSMGEATAGALIEHNLCVSNEVGIAIKDESTPTVRYNTLYDNGVGIWVYPSAPGYTSGKGTFTGGIVWKSKQSDFDLSSDAATVFSYTCASNFSIPLGGSVSGVGLISPGAGCDNPMFADPDNADPSLWDFHLKSMSGRYAGQTGLNFLSRPAVTPTRVADVVSSPCIDKGDPAADPTILALEPVPNGSRIDLGCYGGTPEAAFSP
ncbi:MAG TPA: right-handed parallel beta-helix repeat-containing protein, partial [Polyangiaceae bacterium]